MKAVIASLACAVSLLPAGLVAGEAEVNARWQGAWVVTGVPTHSDCAGRYTNNDVRGDLVVADARFHFAPGELAQVAKVNVNRRRIEVLLDLSEPILAARQEGPFTLYEELRCPVELRFDRPDGGDAVLDGLIAGSLERHTAVAAARDSSAWNGRQREDYPEDYEDTLADYEIWRAQQINAEVQARLDGAIDETATILRRVDDSPEYLAGFAAGVESGRAEYYPGDCGALLGRTVDGAVDRAPSGKTIDWQEGFEDGQRLLYFSEMARRLRGCFVPAPY